MPSQQQTLSQRRAAFAWKQIDAIETTSRSWAKDKQDSLKKKYGTWARKVPALIQVNGLGATMAFLLAKAKGEQAKDGYGLLYQHLSAWIMDYLGQTGDLMALITHGSTDVYRRATTEAIQYSMWLRRYVEAKDWGSLEDEE